jgi:predicted Fe-S protein YdhL (DUF1289 family)
MDLGMDEARQRRLLDRERRRAERLRLLAGGPPSPCIGVCRLDERTGYCLGCFRTIEEIGDWMAMMPDEKEALMPELARRRAQAAEPCP